MLSDTPRGIQRLQIELAQRMSPAEKIEQVRKMTDFVVRLSRRAIARANPELTEAEVNLRWVELSYGRKLASELRDDIEPQDMQSQDAVTAVTPVVAEFERLGVRYYVGGSLAASVYGLSRTTLDIDLVADLTRDHAAPLTAVLQPAYYVNQQTILEAIARKSCFNLICLANSFKVDVFVQQDREYDRAVFQRIRPDCLVPDEPSTQFHFPSPEDVVLAKLQWYRLGDETSERQWRDIIEVMMVQGKVLDRPYLDRWATELGVADLLVKARKEAEA